MTDSVAKTQARTRVAKLVAAFKRNEADYLRPNYNETQTRTDFITPLLDAFGWDVHNSKGYQLAHREVIEEATVEVGEEKSHKRPDYELRLARQRKLFVEAKKPSISIDTDPEPAFQIRRYGFSASLPVSVLTNFRQIAIYDCRYAPSDSEAASVARRLIVSCEEFAARFDDLWPLLSREAVYSGEFDQQFVSVEPQHGVEQFDEFFLQQVQNWRECLATDIFRNTPTLTPTELTHVTQTFLIRIIFLRICEDRDIEKYETLQNLDSINIFDALMVELRRADDFYNSGLFRLVDDANLNIRISDATLSYLINELYYPSSPYTFAVVEPEVLGEIYEHFLGDTIEIEDNLVKIVNKPEVQESGGVVPTPRYIADTIAERTLRPLLLSKEPDELQRFTVADICCGSGTFLLAAYEILLDHYLDWYLNNDYESHVGHRIYETTANQWRLTFDERRRILCAHLRGVDIDPNAVEIAQFSLHLKLIEGETFQTLKDYVNCTQTPVLPTLETNIRCGNSLVSSPEWRATFGSDLTDYQINPFDWKTEFPVEISRGGFDAIIGNPPYIRIQRMAKYSPDEVTFFQKSTSPYSTAEHRNFDKYFLFIERSTRLLKETGCIGAIVPNKFMTIQSGRALRRLITSYGLREIVHFGVEQIFGTDISNYTCILILGKMTVDEVQLERPRRLESWRYGEQGSISLIPIAELDENPWQFANQETRTLFDRIKATHTNKLSEFADIFVGVQTSADHVYIFQSIDKDEDSCTLFWNNQDWTIERDILRPCLKDVPLSQFARPQANAWIIFPYDLVSAGADKMKARLIQPTEMEARFPNCWAYLNARREELEIRNIMGGVAAERQWYQYGRSQSLAKFNGDKIILPALSRGSRYVYDDRNIIVTGGGNGPYYLVRSSRDISNQCLLAILNHPLIEAFVRTNTSVFRGGYYSHGKQFIEELPIPILADVVHGEIKVLVEKLISRLDSLATTYISHDKRRLEREAVDIKQRIRELVSQAFGLTDTDRKIIDAVPIPE